MQIYSPGKLIMPLNGPIISKSELLAANKKIPHPAKFITHKNSTPPTAKQKVRK
jgi:hypothetical protein